MTDDKTALPAPQDRAEPTPQVTCPNCGCDYATAAELRAWKDGTCIACGEKHAGFEVENGPGPFCEECYFKLEEHFIPEVAAPARAHQDDEMPDDLARRATPERGDPHPAAAPDAGEQQECAGQKGEAVVKEGEKGFTPGICARCGKPAPPQFVVCDACQKIADEFNRAIRLRSPENFAGRPDYSPTQSAPAAHQERTEPNLAWRLGCMADAVLSAKVGPQARFFTRERVDQIVLLLREAEKAVLRG